MDIDKSLPLGIKKIRELNLQLSKAILDRDGDKVDALLKRLQGK